MNLVKIFKIIACFLALTSCASSVKKDSPVLQQSQNLTLPLKHVFVSQILIDPLPLREGPGPSYKIFKNKETQGIKALILDKTKSWYKIVLLDGHQIGWVHKKSLSKPTLNSEELHVPLQTFPAVFAKTEQENEGMKINKGMLFYGIRKEQGRILLWSEESRIFLWLALQKVA